MFVSGSQAMKNAISSAQDTITTHSVESVTDFLSKIGTESNTSAIQQLKDENTFVSTVYRGQLKHEKHPLLPQLLRYGGSTATVDGQLRSNSSVNDFRSRESNLITEFKRQSAFFLSASTTPHSDLEWLALAQHHGLATRLLDWSESPLTALFFAVEPTSPEGDVDNADAVVWAFTGARLEGDYLRKNLDEVDELVERIGIRIYYPAYISNRFVAQQGCFTVHSLHPSGLPLEEAFLQHKSRHYQLSKFIVPNARREQIKEELYRLGTNYVSLFPDLDGLCRKLNWLSQKSSA
jgi:hypothetical protein